MNLFLLIIILLVIIIIGLIVYNLNINKRIQTLNNTNDMIKNLKIVQDFIDTIGKDSLAEDKIQTINGIILEKFNIKYSTIVVFNGAEYIIKATNVDERHWEKLKNLQTEEMFKDSIMTATPKYITVDKPGEKLSYQGSEFNRAKSAMFFPIYIDNVYIGYWIIESSEAHAFDSIDTNIFGIIRDNIVSVIRSISYQNTIENIYRIDKTTGLFSAEYIYGKGKRIIDKNAQSSICMFSITNIEEINNKYGRNIGTNTIIKMCNMVKTRIASKCIFVRYMGPKFLIAFSGASLEASVEFLEALKKEIENIKFGIKKGNNAKPIIISPKINMVISTYYKGTGIEEVTKKLEEYLDEADKQENNINCI